MNTVQKRTIMKQMATKYNRTICAWLIFILVSSFETIPHGYVEGIQSLDKNDFEPKPKGTVKTIEVPEDGNLIDCVDIYKQPAFDDPQNKDLQMEPSPSCRNVFAKMKTHPGKIIQNWHKYGECSKGTIPIIRSRKNSGPVHKNSPDNYTHEYAIGREEGSTYFGAGASLNLWNPQVIAPMEFSLTQIWIVSGTGSNLNSIEVGWMVNPHENRDLETRLFIYWTRTNYIGTGCYNLKCTGFMQTNNRIGPGSPFTPMSVYGRSIYDVYITVLRDHITGHWWLRVGDEELGYWPRHIFTNLNNDAHTVDFGGEIINQKLGGHHTATHMGSGHFSSEGLLRASYVRSIEVVNREYDTLQPNLTLIATHPRCYDVRHGPSDTRYGTHIFYGGPGLSDQCP